MVTLHTVEEIIAQLGGVRAVARLVRRGDTAVYNWLAAKRMPSDQYKVMIDALAQRGLTAPSRLWGQRDLVAA